MKIELSLLLILSPDHLLKYIMTKLDGKNTAENEITKTAPNTAVTPSYQQQPAFHKVGAFPLRPLATVEETVPAQDSLHSLGVAAAAAAWGAGTGACSLAGCNCCTSELD